MYSIRERVQYQKACTISGKYVKYQGNKTFQIPRFLYTKSNTSEIIKRIRYGYHFSTMVFCQVNIGEQYFSEKAYCIKYE